MPEPIRVHVDLEDRERIAYWAHQHGLTPLQYLEQLIHYAARNLDAVPPTPRVRRSLSEVREQARLRNLGQPTAYTAAIPTIPKGKP